MNQEIKIEQAALPLNLEQNNYKSLLKLVATTDIRIILRDKLDKKDSNRYSITLFDQEIKDKNMINIEIRN